MLGLVLDDTPGGSILIGARPALTPEQWEKVRDIYEKVLNEPKERRSAAAVRLCAGDSQLASEVGLLLKAGDRAGSFLGEPAVEALGCVPAREPRTDFAAGSVLAERFRILRFLDRGGMGEVYEAWDSDLREIVALKTIRPEIASQPAAIQYFKEEVKHARQISHPNICRVYDLFSHGEGADRIWFLTMQFLEGQTLLEHLKQNGPFGTREALVLIEQMVAGLSAAHELGVVHRDFKSANVMLVPAAGGIRAVITDFGLATRVTDEGPGEQGPRKQGTAEYASPEQWLTGIAGHASDQYALGIVICEMVTGKRPKVWTLASESDAEPVQPVELPANSKLEARWASVVRRCLEIRPEDRFPKVADVVPALDPRRRASTLRLPVVVAASSLAAAVVVLIFANSNRAPVITGLKQVTPAMSLSANPSLSRDGKTIAYMSDRGETGNPDIWVQQLPDGTPTRITTDPATDDSPSISPDGRFVVFHSGHGGIYISDAGGGGERLVVPEGRDPRFSPDGGSIVYWSGDDKQTVASGRIYWLNLAEGAPVQLATRFADARNPIWSSDGRHILFTGCPGREGPFPGCSDWWVTDTQGSAPRTTGAGAILNARRIKPSDVLGGWYGDTVLFSAQHDSGVQLWEFEVSQKDLIAKGEPKSLTSGAVLEHVSSASLAENNIIAFNQLAPAMHTWRIDHASTPQMATVHKVTQSPEYDMSPNISRNGRWLIFARGMNIDRNLWIMDTSTGKEHTVQVTGSDKFVPITDEMGTTFAYESWENGTPSIYLTRPGQDAVKVCSACRNPTGWFGGSALLYSNAGMTEVEMYDPVAKRSSTILSAPGASIAEASWSPEYQYILFTVSHDHTKTQVFAAHFPHGAKVPDRHWIPLTGPSASADKPRWSGDGKTVFYFSDRDSAFCVWGQHFDPQAGAPAGEPFAVRHYHSLEFSPSEISSHNLNLSVAGDSVYLNVAEMNSIIWTGKLTRQSFFLKSWF
jgi:serine/threonine protein kinase